MTNIPLLTKKLNERKPVINRSINSEIKALQRKLVALTFSNGNNTSEYFRTLGEIKNLRKEILS